MANQNLPHNKKLNNVQAHRLTAWLTGLLTLALALFAFILSFNALTDLARQHGVSIPPLFPFVVEFAVVIFSLNALYRSLNNEPAKWQWALIIMSSLLAGMFNIAHASPDWLSRTMAAMPSLFLLLSFESFLSLIKHQVNRQVAIDTLAELQAQIADKRREFAAEIADKQQEINTLIADKMQEADKLDNAIASKQAQLEALKADISIAKSEIVVTKSDIATALQQAKQQAIEERRAIVLEMLHAGSDEKTIAAQLGKDIRTIKADIVALNGKVKEVVR